MVKPDKKIDIAFNEAVKKARNTPIKLPPDTMLLLYAYYKQATIGDCNTECPGMFQFQKKTMWNEWNNLRGISKNDAAKMYIYYAEQYV